MAKFSKNNFIMIIKEIEDMEAADQNIWVPIGILEIMYDDYYGHIDNYFHADKKIRNVEQLYNCLGYNKYTVNWTTSNSDTDLSIKPDPLKGWTWV